MENIIIALIGLVAGLFGAGSYFTRRLDIRIEKEQKKAEARREQEYKRHKARLKKDHAWGRYIFWLNRGIEAFEKENDAPYWNGELRKAYDSFQRAEEEEKELDREDLANANKGE